MAGPRDEQPPAAGPPDTPAIEFLDGAFAIYRFAPGDALPDVASLPKPLAMVGTDEGVTLVCQAEPPVAPQGAPTPSTERCRRPLGVDLPASERTGPHKTASSVGSLSPAPVTDMPFEPAEMSTGWCAFRVEGHLDFALTGVLAGISGVLAEAGISIFAISCWETDYVLVRGERREDARAALADGGYAVR